jgi:hypothetical protein
MALDDEALLDADSTLAASFDVEPEAHGYSPS